MKTEKGLGIALIAALGLKYMNLPMGGFLTMISLSFLSFIYFPLGVLFFYDKEFKRQNIIFSVIYGFFLSHVFLAVLFKLQYYFPSFDQQYLLCALIISFLGSLITYYLYKKSDKELDQYYINIFKRSVIAFVIALIVYFIPATSLIRYEYRNSPEYRDLKIQKYKNPNSKEVKNKMEKYIQEKY